jgi:hypothetical protein
MKLKLSHEGVQEFQAKKQEQWLCIDLIKEEKNCNRNFIEQVSAFNYLSQKVLNDINMNLEENKAKHKKQNGYTKRNFRRSMMVEVKCHLYNICQIQHYIWI